MIEEITVLTRGLFLWGLTPKVELAIVVVVQKGAAQCVRALMAMLHTSAQAELQERISAGSLH